MFHPLARQLQEYEQRVRDGTLRLRSAVTPIPQEIVKRYMTNDHAGVRLFVKQDPPGHPEGRAAEARADVVKAVANDACKINDTESFYLSLFLSDLSDALDDSSKLIDSKTIALLGSSTSTDSLTLMHNRTGHFNMKALIESHKSKLVKGLK